MKHSLKHHTSSRNTKLDIIQTPGTTIVELRIHFKAGFLYFDSPHYHVPHLLEHFLLGHNHLFATEDAFNRALQRYGAIANASTDHEHITVYLRTPLKHLLKTFSLLLESIFSVQVDAKSFETERNIVGREVSEKFDGPGSVLFQAILAQILQGVEPGSWEEHQAALAALTVSDVKQALEQYIRPENMHIIMAGDIAPADEKLIQEQLLKIENAFSAKPVVVPQKQKFVPSSPVFESFSTYDDEGNASFALVCLSPAGESSEKDRVTKNFVSNLLFTSPAAIIPTALRKQGLVYSVDFDVITLEEWGISIWSILTDPDDLPKAVYETIRILKLYASGQFPLEDLVTIKSYAQSILPTVHETVGDVLEWYETALINNKPLSSVEEEMHMVAQLKRMDVGKVTQQLFLGNMLYAGGISKNIDRWGEELFKNIQQIRDSEFPDPESIDTEIRRYESETQAVRAAQSKNSHSVLWFLYCAAAYATFLTLRFPSLPTKDGKGTTSIWQFGVDHHYTWLSVWVLLPMSAAVLLMAFRFRRLYSRLLVATLIFISTVGYWYAIYRFFSDFGVDNQPWNQDLASVLQPIFFYVISPITFGVLVFRKLSPWYRSKSLQAK